MKIDRSAPGGGLDVYSIIENGKAALSFTIYLEGETREISGQDERKPAPREKDRRWVEIVMYDDRNQEAAWMRVPAGENRCCHARTLLIYPRLWQGTQNPCLYCVKATLINDGEEIDSVELFCPVCTMRQIPEKGFFLNEKPFALRAVRYPVTDDWETQLPGDLETLKELGANCICPDRFPQDRAFYELCLENGILVWACWQENTAGEGTGAIPLFCGEEKGLLYPDRRRRRDSFYYYMACWSSEKVLHICRQEAVTDTGPVPVRVYSNQKKAALYVDGILQEFKQSAPVFVFEEVPARGEETVISVQAGECFQSVTWCCV